MLIDMILHCRFSSYGVDVLNYYRLPEEEQREQKNPMCDTFPRIASCDYWRYGDNDNHGDFLNTIAKINTL